MVCFGHRAVDSSLSRVAATASRAVYAHHGESAKMAYLTIDADARAHAQEPSPAIDRAAFAGASLCRRRRAFALWRNRGYNFRMSELYPGIEIIPPIPPPRDQ